MSDYNPFYNVGVDVLTNVSQSDGQPIFWDKPFTAPVTQTFLPLLSEDGANYGYVGVAEHAFTGAETTYVAGGMTFNVAPATLARRVVDNVGQQDPGRPQVQFMAVRLTHQDIVNRIWIGSTTWVEQSSGVFARWTMPLVDARKDEDFGALYNAVRYGFWVIGQPQQPDPMPDPTDGTLRWACELSLADASQECAFFDFPWMDVFKASFTEDKCLPKSIDVVSNPPGGEFIAKIVTAPGGPQFIPGVGPAFNTIRIMKMKDVTAGTYEFEFLIKDTGNNEFPVTLTLTVPATFA